MSSAGKQVGTSPILSVVDFVALVNQTLDVAYGDVIVEGEISGFRVSKNKYVYFDLKDELATVNCFMTVYQLRTPLEDGMRVRIYGAPRLTPWGRFSLTVRVAEPAGEGALKKALVLLQAKLSGEGLFDEARKRPLPALPERVGLITAAGSAAAADFLKITETRWGGLQIQLMDVFVQGVEAPDQLVRAIDYFNQEADPPEVLIIIRGGGSVDDLAAFSTEPVVRAVAGSRIPTLVAIGHESDLSLAELAADVRASTPSNAAELLVPDKAEEIRQLSSKRQQLKGLLVSTVELKGERLYQLKQTLAHSLKVLLQTITNELALKRTTLDALSPQAVLSRGYAVIKVGSIAVGSVQQLKVGYDVDIQMRDGTVSAQISGTKG